MEDQILFHPITMPPKNDIQRDDKRYSQSRKEKELAMEEILSIWEQSYKLLPSYVFERLLTQQ